MRLPELRYRGECGEPLLEYRCGERQIPASVRPYFVRSTLRQGVVWVCRGTNRIAAVVRLLCNDARGTIAVIFALSFSALAMMILLLARL